MKQTTYLSVDIEADGPIPGMYSMLSIGAAAFQQDRSNSKGFRQLNTFKRNILPLPDALQDPDTMQWWATQPAAWKAATEDAIPAEQAMKEFVAWCRSLPGPLVFIGFPVVFDFMFVYWYIVRFTGERSPFGKQGLDIKTLTFERLNCEFKEATKRNMPRTWFRNSPAHTHDALDDAIGQGVLLMNILND